MVIFINAGESYNVFCKPCFDKNIDDIRREHGLLVETHPIFLSSEYDNAPVCEDCNESIECEIIVYHSTGCGDPEQCEGCSKLKGDNSE